MTTTCENCGKDIYHWQNLHIPTLCKACQIPGRDNLPHEMQDRHPLPTEIPEPQPEQPDPENHIMIRHKGKYQTATHEPERPYKEQALWTEYLNKIQQTQNQPFPQRGKGHNPSNHTP